MAPEQQNDLLGNKTKSNSGSEPNKIDEEQSDADNHPSSRNTEVRASTDPYTISLDSSISLPEVPGNFTQDNWTGGAGQSEWSNEKMYDSGEDIDGNFPDGRLELEKDQIIEAWDWLNFGPGRRYRHTAVWDPVNKQVLIYGGYRGWGGARDTLFAYSSPSDSWSEKATLSPGRVDHTAVWDSRNNVMLVFGGRTGGSDLSKELWAYDPVTNEWTQKNSSGPSARRNHMAVYDDSAGVMIVYGGYTGSWSDLDREVWIYNSTFDNWTRMNNFTVRAYAGALWNPDDQLMYVYGGTLAWSQGSGHTYTGAVNTYDCRKDLWVNKSNSDGRVRANLVYDSVVHRIIVYGGENDTSKNDTRFYYPDIDSWESALTGPEARDYTACVWDDFNDRLLMYGGARGQTVYSSLWHYSPYTKAYGYNGSLISSTYNCGSPVKFKKISFDMNEPEPELGGEPVRIKLAGGSSSSGPWDFLGPDGSTSLYFTKSGGEDIPVGLEGSQYLKYYLNLSTEYLLYSPVIKSIRIDYFTYESSETFDYGPFQPPSNEGAVHMVELNVSEPAGTTASVFIRYGSSTTAIQSAAWEEVDDGQQVFDTTPDKFFEYRVSLSSTDPIQTPVVHNLDFIFNRAPDAPKSLSPGNGSHYGSSTPLFTWVFSDPDGLFTDEQDGYELQVSFRAEFDFFNYNSGAVTTNISSCLADTISPDGYYYWRVKVRDNYGSWSAWSPVYKVYIDTIAPGPPEIKCYTHPSNGTWYSENTAIFDWDEADDISGIAGYSYSLNQSTGDSPENTILLSANEFSLKKNDEIFEGLLRFSNLDDGIWYFKLKAVDSLGHWGPIRSFAFKIDKTKPTVTDKSDVQASTGENLKFEFDLEDAHSGLSTAELYWRYSYEKDYETEFINIVDEDTVSFEYQMKDIDSTHIEYYLMVTDNAQPANTYRHPGGGSGRIPFVDNDPPTVINGSGDFTVDLTRGMTVTIKGHDNIDVEIAEIYLAGEVTPRFMREVTIDFFEFEADQTLLKELFLDGTLKDITYYIILKDAWNNSVRYPIAGEYTISAEETVTDGDGTGDGKDEAKEVKGVSYAAAAGIVAVVVIVFLILLFFMLKKQKEKIEDEQSKIRMQLLSDVGPETAPTTPVVQGDDVSPPSELAGMDGMPPVQQPHGGVPAQFPEQQPPPGLPPAGMEPAPPPGDAGDLQQPPGDYYDAGYCDASASQPPGDFPQVEQEGTDQKQPPAGPGEDISFTPREAVDQPASEISDVSLPAEIEEEVEPGPKLKKKVRKKL